MNRYRIELKKFGLLLLPTFLRKPVIGALLYSAINPLSEIFAAFLDFKTSTDYRLTHNGQICYLRAVLNDAFDEEKRRIMVADSGVNGGVIRLFMSELENSLMIPQRAAGTGLIINRRGFAGVGSYDFWITIPYDLASTIDTARLKGIINTYKLASKRYAITYAIAE